MIIVQVTEKTESVSMKIFIIEADEQKSAPRVTGTKNLDHSYIREKSSRNNRE